MYEYWQVMQKTSKELTTTTSKLGMPVLVLSGDIYPPLGGAAMHYL